MRRFILPISLLISGCSSLGGSHKHEPLIGSLENQIPDSIIETQPVSHREAAIHQYQAYLASNPDDKYAPEAMRRLADLTLENEQNADIQGTSPSNKTPSKAAELYQTLLDQYPDSKNSETVAYQLARAYEQHGDEKTTFKALTAYAQQYPEASNIAEIQFRRGEYLFSMGEYEDAEKAYLAAVSKSNRSDFFLPALYKAGWSQFKQNTIEASLTTFMRLLDNTIADHNSANLPTNISKAEQGRLQDTLRAIGLGFSYLGSADEIDRYFTKNGHKTYEPLLYASLASLHFKKQRFSDAAETWRHFSSIHPDHPEAPLFQAHVIDVYTHAGFNDRALIEKQAFVNTYLPGSPYWEKHDISQSEEIISKTENWLNDITIHYHAIADEDKTPAAYATASQWYTTYLNGFPDSDKTPAINFLFAELLLDANQLQRAIEEFERTAYDYAKHPQSAESGYAALLAYTDYEKTLSEEKKTTWHRKGIDSAIRFSDSFPNHSQALAVRLRAAEQLFALKDFTAAIKTAKTLVDRETISPVIALPAWTILANAWYETSDFVKAEGAYNQVLALLPAEDTERVSIQTRLAASIYKQGEMARQSGQLTMAIKHFTRVAQVLPGSAIAATADYDTAAAYITLRKTYEPLLYASLASLHFKKQRFSDAAETWRHFSSIHPDHPEAPLFQAHVIDVYTHAGFNDRALIEKQAFVNTYLPGSPYWEKHDISQSEEIISKTENWLNDITIHYHAIADEDKTPAAYATASQWYTTYLNGFPDSDKTPAINFLFAELLLDANQLQRAIEEFERTAYDYAKHPQSAESGYAALLAYTDYEKTLSEEKKTTWHRKGIDSAIRFSDSFPNHSQALAVRLRAAEQLFALKDFTAAIKTAKTLVDRETISPVIALPAWTILANAWYETSDFVKAEGAYNQVLALLPAEDTERVSIQTRLAASIYKQGEMARQSGQLTMAIKHFTRVAQVLPGSAIAATADYDTAAAYITLQQIPQAIETLESWRQSYPDHKLNIDASRKLAVLYRNNKQPLQAATAYAYLAEQGTDPQQQREARWTAASLFLEGGDKAAASRGFTAYIQHHPIPQEQAMEARAKLVDIYTSTGNNQQQHYWQQQIITAYDTSTNKTDRGRYLAAHAQLSLAEPLLTAYSSVALVEPLQQNLLLKKKYLTQAINAYSKAASYHIADVSTESTYQTGHLYADFSESLMQSQRPASLSAEELEQYDILLEEQAFPIEEQAIEIHEANVSNIADDHYDDWTRKSLAELARLLPARYRKIERSETYVKP